VWRLGTWECERTLTGHNGGVVGVCIVHGTPHLATTLPTPVSKASSLTRHQDRFVCHGGRGCDSLVIHRLCTSSGNLVSASNDSFIKVWNSTGIQRPFTAK
jgi:WD40 repeat protein